MPFRLFSIVTAVVCAAACSSPRTQPPPATTEPAPAPAQQQVTAIGQLPLIDQNAVLAHTKMLASDEFEGRAPGTPGEDLTINYLVDEYSKIGVKPGNSDGGYVQKVPLAGITPAAATMALRKGGQRAQLKWRDDLVAWTRHVAETAKLENSELVFVGYGVVAPEYNWDDYKGVDLKGKTLVMLINDPPVPDPSDASKLDPKTFGGRAMTYYGRWTYKFDIGAQKGAAGVLIIHETEPAGYPFSVVQGNLGERFNLVTPDKNMSKAAIEGWVSLDAGRKLLKMGGQDFDALKKLAATRDFKPVPLGITASITLHNKLRTVNSRNVIGRIDGSDPRLKNEYVIYTAHWDHFGIGAPVDGDKIYNGARDNAVGVAGMLEIARAFKKLPTPPKRSIVFIALTSEEQGLLGSEYYATMPVYPLAKTLADINIDGLDVHGRTRDLTLVGYGASDLDDYAAMAAGEQGRTVHGDAEPEKGFYYRSDHFNFAKQGVPALDPDAGLDYLGKPADYGKKIRDEWTEHIYHSPQDEVKPDWDLSGAREDLEVFFAVGYRVAQADKYPEWKPGNEFRAKREQMLKGAK